MIENGTFHVITTELVVGSFALAGVCFVLHALFTWREIESPQYSNVADTTAHAALFFGLLALPFAILSGLGASPTGAHTSPLLANKMLLSTAGGGLAIGVLFTRWKNQQPMGKVESYIHNLLGASSTGCMLLTASLGGTYSRGDSLTEFIPWIKTSTPLLPSWMSILVMLIVIAALILRRTSTVKHV